ncbi:MAG: glycosyltransferase [Candidatus Pacearchaeota archaeon]|jgi:predicted glycosyltransferase involved in capsule biosynthesis
MDLNILTLLISILFIPLFLFNIFLLIYFIQNIKILKKDLVKKTSNSSESDSIDKKAEYYSLLEKSLIDSLKISNHRILKTLYDPHLTNNNNDITIIIPWKDIGVDRIENSLKSILNQDYSHSLIRTLVIDYGSKKNIEKIKDLCKQNNAEYIRVDGVKFWNRSHALNIGIKKSKSKYILATDIDIIFEKNYLSSCVRELKENPFQLVYVDMFDCSNDISLKYPDKIKDYYKIKIRSKKRVNPGILHGSSICFTLRDFFYMINGYDEEYKIWGYEDFDLLQRFGQVGIIPKNISNKTSHIHQFHPPKEGVSDLKEKDIQINKNRDIFHFKYTYERNLQGWGKG